LYCANIGRDYFLAIFFDAQVRRGRIGTVWVFTSRAISSLRTMLVEDQIEQASEFEPLEDSRSDGVPEIIKPIEKGTENEFETRSSSEVGNSFEESGRLPVIGETSIVGESDPSIAAEEELSNASGSDVLEAPVVETQDGEMPDPENQDDNQAISFEEALERGIISPDFDPDKN